MGHGSRAARVLGSSTIHLIGPSKSQSSVNGVNGKDLVGIGRRTETVTTVEDPLPWLGHRGNYGMNVRVASDFRQTCYWRDGERWWGPARA